MITAIEARLNSLSIIDEYCEEHIKPKILKSNDNSIIFGCYYEDGSAGYISDLYCNRPPLMRHDIAPSAFQIAKYLQLLGYHVELIRNDHWYPAGRSKSKRTLYYE